MINGIFKEYEAESHTTKIFNQQQFSFHLNFLIYILLTTNCLVVTLKPTTSNSSEMIYDPVQTYFNDDRIHSR